MTITRLAGILAAGGMVFVGTLFFFDSQTRNLQTHTRATDALRLMKEADATLTRDVLRARFGLLPSYDPLLQKLASIKERQREFWEASGVAYGASREKIRRQVEGLAATLKLKTELIEEFKSRNAILKNSLSYLPVAHERLIRIADKDRELAEAIRIDAPIRNILLFDLTGDPQYVPRIRASLKSLTSIGDQTPSGASAVALLTAHAEKIIQQRDIVGQLVTQLVKTPTASRIDELQAACQVLYQRSAGPKDRIAINSSSMCSRSECCCASPGSWSGCGGPPSP
jgi:hypothetical protein